LRGKELIELSAFKDSAKLIYTFLDSNFFQSFAIIVAGGIGLGRYYKRQRIDRLQKIYFNELNNQVTSLDAAFVIVQHNNYIFKNSLAEAIEFTKGKSLMLKEAFLENLIARKKLIKIYSLSTVCNKEIMIELFGKVGYLLHQWFNRAERDIYIHNDLINSHLQNIINFIKLSDAQEKNKVLDSAQKTAYNHSVLIKRHWLILYLLRRLMVLLSAEDFASLDDIERLKAKPEVARQLNKTAEIFKILFGFYVSDNHTYYSYAQNQQGAYYKINFASNDQALISQEYLVDLPPGEFKICFDKCQVDDALLDGNSNLAVDLIELANCRVFEKPGMLPKLETF